MILTGKGTWMGFLTRETMEQAQSFKEAMTMLTSKQMIAPAYFILGGNKSEEVTMSWLMSHVDFLGQFLCHLY